MISIVQMPADADGRTFVEWREPKGSPNRRIFLNDDEAHAGFSDLLARLRELDGSSAMWRCRLIVDYTVVEQESVVRALSDVL
jgi:hypothetical protein